MQKRSRLHITYRKGATTISGPLYYPDARKPFRLQKRADSDIYENALQEAIDIETTWYTTGPGSRNPQSRALNFTFGDAVEKYLDETTRSRDNELMLERLKTLVGADTRLSDIGQDTVTKLKKGALAGRAEQTVERSVITPLSYVLNCALRNEMIQKVPKFVRPEKVEGRTVYLMPDEAERMIEMAADHFKTLLLFFFCTGAREAEAVYLDWKDVNLKGGAVTLWGYQTKGKKKRRDIDLPPRLLAALANLPNRAERGPVFLKPDGQPYARNRTKSGHYYGGRTKKAWRGARDRAGISPEYVLHSTRHTWASWHFALYRDLLKLRDDGGWASEKPLSVYTHRMFRGHEQEVCNFLGIDIRSLAIQLPVPLVVNDNREAG
jgi:integrase